jgi:hypothetical protein
LNYFWILNKSKIRKNHQVEDCGLDLTKVKGLYSKMTCERRMGDPKPQDLKWTAQIRSNGGERGAASREH